MTSVDRDCVCQFLLYRTFQDWFARAAEICTALLCYAVRRSYAESELRDSAEPKRQHNIEHRAASGLVFVRYMLRRWTSSVFDVAGTLSTPTGYNEVLHRTRCALVTRAVVEAAGE